MWIILILIAASLAVFFLPQMKGYRTQVFAVITATWTALLPLLTELLGHFQKLDWREYVGVEAAPWIVLGSTVGFMVLRYMTTTPVGKK